MEGSKDAYCTISKRIKMVHWKVENRKFYGYAFPFTSKNELQPITILRKQHRDANHFCYAWQLNTSFSKFKANDDGEPSKSAGMPIHGQTRSFGLTNVLVIVVRIFGGIKLAVGGLIKAYRDC